MPDDFDSYYLKQIGVLTPAASALPAVVRQEPAQLASPAAIEEEKPNKGDTSADLAVGLQELQEQVRNCQACALARTRTQTVFGVGNPEADLVLIGEAPGQEEDLQGEPFVGRAGKLLDRMLAALGFDRSQVYIMNVLKCRPPKNRDPEPAEVQACAKWFDAQLTALSPKVICLLGRVAAQTVLETDASLGSLRGGWHKLGDIPLKVTYHPAYLLRSPAQKSKSWEDLRAVAARLCEGQ